MVVQCLEHVAFSCRLMVTASAHLIRHLHQLLPVDIIRVVAFEHYGQLRQQRQEGYTPVSYNVRCIICNFIALINSTLHPHITPSEYCVYL